METLRVGPKKRHLEIPEGYILLEKEKVVTRKLAENCRVANIVSGSWMRLDAEDIDQKAESIGDFVIWKP